MENIGFLSFTSVVCVCLCVYINHKVNWVMAQNTGKINTLIFNCITFIKKKYWIWMNIWSFSLHLRDSGQYVGQPLSSSCKVKETASKETADNMLKLKTDDIWHLEEQFANILVSLAFIQPCNLHLWRLIYIGPMTGPGRKMMNKRVVITAVMEPTV